MPNIRKKAIADAVAVVFLISITILSAGILFTAVTQTSKQLSPVLSCTEMQINPPITVEDVCLNLETNEIEAKIRRSATIDAEIFSLKFRIDSPTETAGFECGLSCGGNCAILNQASTKTYFFDAEKFTNPNNFILEANNCILENKKIEIC